MPVGSVSDPNADLVLAVAERLTGDRAWVACLADEVGERMLTGPLKQRLSVLLTTMLYQRASVHGEAIAMLSGALAELKEEWRTTQGGVNGGPTDTETLLRMVDRSSKLVRESEEAVQRTIKLALEEQRAVHDYADGIGPTLYQGTGEKLSMPGGVTSGDREIIRSLLGMIGKHATDANTIEVEGTPLPPSPPGGGDPPSQDACAEGGQHRDGMVGDDVIGSVSDPTAGPGTPPAGGGGGGAPLDVVGGGRVNDSNGGTSSRAGTPRGTANPSAASAGSDDIDPSRCSATTGKGTRCSRDAVDGTHCTQHGAA